MIIDWLEEWFKGVLIDGIIGNLSGLFDTVNTKVGEIAADVGATPQGWNSGIFNMIRNLSESVIIPIAGAILASACSKRAVWQRPCSAPIDGGLAYRNVQHHLCRPAVAL